MSAKQTKCVKVWLCPFNMSSPAVPGRDYDRFAAEWLEEDVCLYLVQFSLEFGFFDLSSVFSTEIWDLVVPFSCDENAMDLSWQRSLWQ